eukprot:TRINITY_DN10294_c0_g1_i1.p1 TRINITY_DN10294_c0_g1~~TRINITY_DN10294_c0_g1_i1.p1  ORF type:complete len:141 (-),score=12.36 TRINITY_DN10294_c0_g1_i1:83-505(-)
MASVSLFMGRIGVNNPASLQNLINEGYYTWERLISIPPSEKQLQDCGFTTRESDEILKAIALNEFHFLTEVVALGQLWKELLFGPPWTPHPKSVTDESTLCSDPIGAPPDASANIHHIDEKSSLRHRGRPSACVGPVLLH